MTPRLRAGAEDAWVLAVDLGTGGPKVGLVSLAGAIAWNEHRPVADRARRPTGAPPRTPGCGGTWSRDSARRALASGAVDPGRVVAVSCTGQWASTVPVDADGVPVGPCQLWSDTRGGPHSRRVIAGPVAGYDPVAAVRWIRHSGGAPSTSGADPIGHILHLEHDEPDVARAARWYLEPVDYLSMRFTGVAAATPASMAGAWLTDNRRPGLPRLRPGPGPDERRARRQAPAPAGHGLASSGPCCRPWPPTSACPTAWSVVAGTPDLHSACVGSGAVLELQPHVAISTTSWVSCPFPKKKTDAVRQMATVPGILPGLRLVANNQESGGRALEWFRDSVGVDPVTGLRPPTTT